MPPPALTVGTALPDPPFELMQDGKAGGVRHRLTQLIAARLNAAVLLRLHRLGGTVGQRREMVNALKQGLKNDYKTTDIVTACESMERPTLFIFVPDDRRTRISVRPTCRRATADCRTGLTSPASDPS
jgi:hypothetical protein